MGFLFKVMARDYLLESGFTRSSFYIRRNDDRLEFPILIEPNNVTKAECIIMWSPQELKLCRLEEDWDKGIFTHEDRIRAVDKRTKVLRASLFSLPIQLSSELANNLSQQELHMHLIMSFTSLSLIHFRHTR